MRAPTNPITHEVYHEDKGKYLSMINSVTDMERILLTNNMEKKRILSEIDRIDDTKVKTRDMIAKRRRLEEELQQQ